MGKYFSFRGKVYLGRRDAAGNPMGLTHVGNVPDCTLGFSVETFEHQERMSGEDLTDLSLIKGKTGEISITTEELLKDNFTYVLGGKVKDVTSGSVTDEALCTAPQKGKIYLLAHQNVSSVTMKHDSSTVDMNKFRVNELHGSIEFLDAAGLTGAVTVSYSYGAATSVSIFSETQQDVWFRLEGLNKIGGDRVVVDLYKVSFAPVESMALINDELGNMPLKGKVLADTSKPAGGEMGQFGRIVIIPKE